MLFGECAEVLGKRGKMWLRVRLIHDNLIGWVHANQVSEIPPSKQEQYQGQFAYSLEFIHPIMSSNASRPIPIGSRLPNFDGLRCTIGEEYYNFSGQAVFTRDVIPSADLIVKFARRYLYAPFLQGGRSPLGIDAAALVQLVYSFVGIDLPRIAAQQVEKGRTVDFVQQAQNGDIAFFENKAGSIHHVGILLPNKYIIHAFGQVRIDKIDHYGIFNEQSQKYTHRLRIVRRMLGDNIISNEVEGSDMEIITNQIGLF